jgi:hypothetical protein
MSTDNPDPVCRGLIAAFLPQLSKLAHDAVVSGKRRDDFVVVVIDAAEEPWGPLILKARQELQPTTTADEGKRSVILGVLPIGFAQLLAKCMPRFEEALTGMIPGNFVRCICLANGSISIMMLVPEVDVSELN